MADLDSTNPSATSDDPVAEFLAREQSVLGDLEDDLIDKVDVEIPQAPTTNENEDLINNINSNGITTLNGDINGDFDHESGDLSNGLGELSLNDNGIKSSSMDGHPPSMISQPIIPAEEPESIKRWREQHLKNLELKDEEEKEKIEELRQQAKKELDEWYQKYQEQLNVAKKQNRATEKEWIAERDNEQPGQAWEKISRMCDFNPKTSRNNRDTSRMRSILLQLKQNPPISSSTNPSSSN